MQPWDSAKSAGVSTGHKVQAQEAWVSLSSPRPGRTENAKQTPGIMLSGTGAAGLAPAYGTGGARGWGLEVSRGQQTAQPGGSQQAREAVAVGSREGLGHWQSWVRARPGPG